MASSSGRSVTEFIRDDFLTCHICLEMFTDPRILPCLHTYCFRCICTHVDSAQAGGRPAVCPECQGPFPGKASLRANVFINGLADVVKEKSVESPPCTACNLRGVQSTAKVKCLDCGDHLCSTCSDGHNSSTQTWKHEKIPLDDMRRGVYDDKLRQHQKIKCPSHKDNDVDFNCKVCFKAVCISCVLLDHRSHTCQTLSEAAAGKKDKITGLTKILRDHLQRFEKDEKNIKMQLDAIAEQERKEKLEIEKKAQKEIGDTKKKKKTELERITRKSQTDHQEHTVKLKDLKLQKNNFSSCITFSDTILDKGKDEEVLLLESMITERLQCLQIVDKNKSNIERNHGPVKVTTNVSSNATQFLETEEQEKAKHNYGSEASPSQSKSSSFCHQIHDTNRSNESQETAGDASKNLTKVYLRQANAYSTKFSADVWKPYITGMVYSNKFGLVVSDYNNGKIKILSTNGNLNRELRTPKLIPSAVAVVGDTIGAISENCLVLFCLKGEIKRTLIAKKKPDETLHFTYALAGSDSAGFVVGNLNYEKRLCFYSMKGEITRWIDCSVQLPLSALSFSPSGNLILSEWGAGRIRMITPEGKLVFKVMESGWKPNGTCSSENGTIFVSEYLEQGISVYSSTGHHMLDYKTKSDGMRHPHFVAIYDKNMMHVANNDGKVCVYSVSQATHST